MVGGVPLLVATWNLFHGQAHAAGGDQAVAIEAFADALVARRWDCLALQEVPPGWAGELGRRLGASVRESRTSLWRSLLPALQARLMGRRRGDLGVRGAAVNAILVRGGATAILEHRSAALRRFPQRRTVHGVRLRRPDGSTLWFCNAHTHNRPLAAAGADTAEALQIVGDWAGDAPVILAGDLNLPDPSGLAAVAGFTVLHGHRVDHILARSARANGSAYADRVELAPGVTLADHRIVGVRVS